MHPSERRPSPLLLVAGTRPECIKLVPVIDAMRPLSGVPLVVVNSGQHRDAVRSAFAGFGIRCDIELEPPSAPTLRAAGDAIRGRIRAAIEATGARRVLVQGDTLTAYAGARAGSEAGATVIHVEAGLRTDRATDPFPEEWLRRRIARLADIHFAPSASAVGHLLREGVAAAAIHHVGNTGIDCLRQLLTAMPSILDAPAERDTVLVTLHRRENWGDNADRICDALIALAGRRPDLRLVFPVHPNPRVAPRLRSRLAGRPGFELVTPLDYAAFVRAAAQAALVISDSGGVQEEIPHLGTPLLVPRANTERPEAVATGFVELVPADPARIVEIALARLAAPRRVPLAFDDDAPFGAGDAGVKIARVLASTGAESVAGAVAVGSPA
jgi:UDP-N-acetylglucosamine 2-epimerase (non-hydrolysing)